MAVPHGMWDLSSLTRNSAHTTCSGNIEVLSLNYPTAGKVCRFMSYTQFGCFQPPFLKIALSGLFSFFSSCGILVVQMLDQLFLSQRFLRLFFSFFLVYFLWCSDWVHFTAKSSSLLILSSVISTTESVQLTHICSCIFLSSSLPSSLLPSLSSFFPSFVSSPFFFFCWDLLFQENL